MAARQAAGIASATTSTVLQDISSSMFNASSTNVTNNTLSLPLRALQYTVRAEKLLFRKTLRILLQISGLQTLASVVSNALGMPAPPGGRAGVNRPGAVDGVAAGPGEPQTWTAALLEAFELGNSRSLGGMFNFLFSRWAFACVAMVRRT